MNEQVISVLYKVFKTIEKKEKFLKSFYEIKQAWYQIWTKNKLEINKMSIYFLSSLENYNAGSLYSLCLLRFLYFSLELTGTVLLVRFQSSLSLTHWWTWTDCEQKRFLRNSVSNSRILFYLFHEGDNFPWNGRSKAENKLCFLFVSMNNTLSFLVNG